MTLNFVIATILRRRRTAGTLRRRWLKMPAHDRGQVVRLPYSTAAEGSMYWPRICLDRIRYICVCGTSVVDCTKLTWHRRPWQPRRSRRQKMRLQRPLHGDWRRRMHAGDGGLIAWHRGTRGPSKGLTDVVGTYSDALAVSDRASESVRYHTAQPTRLRQQSTAAGTDATRTGQTGTVPCPTDAKVAKRRARAAALRASY